MRFKASLLRDDSKRLIRKLKKLDKDMMTPVQKVILAGAMTIKNDAQRYMPQSRGGITRTVYRDETRVQHTASAPGHPPAVDTGTLVANVAIDIDSDRMGASIGTNVLHGAYMEFGTATVAARPWLFPAHERNRKKIVDWMKRAANKVLKRGGK